MTTGLGAMIRKEFRQILRDPRTLGVLLILPLMLLVLFGFALSMDVENLKIGVVDRDHTPESRRVITAFRTGDLFVPAGPFADVEAAEEALITARLDAAVVLPPGFGRDLTAGRKATVQVLLSGSDIIVASAAKNAVNGVFTDLSVRLGVEWRLPQPPSVPSSPVDYRPQTLFNPELKSTVYLVPGLISFIMVISAVVSTALSVVREKEKGTMELLEVSPLSPVTLIVGKTVPYMVVSILETLLILLAGRLVFGVTIQGDFFLLLLTITLFLISCLGLGLIISTVAETQQTAFLISTVATVLPSFILSGFVFPIRNMPPLLRLVTHIIPARYFLEAERALIIRGAGFEAVWRQIAALAIFSVITLAISSVRLGMGRRR